MVFGASHLMRSLTVGMKTDSPAGSSARAIASNLLGSMKGEAAFELYGKNFGESAEMFGLRSSLVSVAPRFSFSLGRSPLFRTRSGSVIVLGLNVVGC